MNAERKHKSLTVAEKLNVLNAVKSGTKKKKDIAQEFGIPPSTLSTILKNKNMILSQESSGNLNHKRKREAEFPDVEQCLMKWFQQCRDHNVSLGGHILKEKAENFAKSLGYGEFRASNGWLEKFKRRHNIVFRKMCGESASVSEVVCNEWKNELETMLQDYEPHNVFNADESGLFFKCLPDRTLTFKDEKCHGGKHSKERVTILFITNMTGTEKLKLFFIGKSAKPRCFAGIKSLPVDYKANRKAWMTSELFAGQLIKLDIEMKKQKRKILLFIDNCTAHNKIPPLQSVVVKFLPPNTTSKLQPLDQGIIQNFKTLYRKEVVRTIILDIEEGRKSSISLLQAARMAVKSWKNVSQTTIVNGFKKCGFVSPIQEEALFEEIGVITNAISEEEWCFVSENINASGITFDTFVQFDDNVAVTGTMTDEDIIDSVTQNTNSDTDEEDIISKEASAVPAKEAKAMVNKLRTFFEISDGTTDVIFSALVRIENAIDTQMYYQKQKQSKITDFYRQP